MNNAINWMHYLSEGKLYYSRKTKQQHKLYINFITLTLCAKQFHDDKYIVNRMLKPFLKWMKRQGNQLYVWRAESQANGNLHFHITSNKYLHWQSIRNKWNSIQQNHGYLRKYIQNGGDENPNSTDVEGVKDASKLAGYMVKYMGKNAEENFCTRYCSINEKPDFNTVIKVPVFKSNGTVTTSRRDLTCKVWSCSSELQNKRITLTEMDEGFQVIASEIENRCESKQLNGFTLFTYPSPLFRNGCLNYADEQISINKIQLDARKKENTTA